MASITLREIDKKYGKVHAVRGITMDIADGEFIAFLGPSGCGKSSTMRMIAGLEEITGGDILFGGESVIRKQPCERNVAMAFENYALYPTLTVYENLAFPLRSAGVNKEELDKRVRDMAEVVGLTGILEKRTPGLSSGQAQAVSLARALIRKPNVLLLDEPISHLDTSQRFAMRMYIKRLHIDLGYTMILVTHDQEDAMSMADRVAVMEMGKLHQIATPREIYDHPANRFVAGFIGDIPMNFLPCAPMRENGTLYLAGDGLRIALPDRYANADLCQCLEIGVRPYDLKVAAAQQENAFAAKVLHVECLGDMNVVLAQFEDVKVQVAASVLVKPNRGEVIWLKPDMRKASLFDRDSGNAVSM